MIFSTEQIIECWNCYKQTLLLSKLRNNDGFVTNLEFHDALVLNGTVKDPQSYPEFAEFYFKFLLRASRNFGILKYRSASSNNVGHTEDEPDRTKWLMYYDSWAPTDLGLELMQMDPNHVQLKEIVDRQNRNIMQAVRLFKETTKIARPTS